jgi:hypothetical protein
MHRTREVAGSALNSLPSMSFIASLHDKLGADVAGCGDKGLRTHVDVMSVTIAVPFGLIPDRCERPRHR